MKKAFSIILTMGLLLGILSGCSSAQEPAKDQSVNVQIIEESSLTEASAGTDSASTEPAAGLTDESAAETSAADGAQTSESAENTSSYVPFDFSSAIDDNGYLKGITAKNYVELCDYMGIVIPGDVAAVSEEEIQSEIDYMLENYAETEQVMDKAVEDGDTVNIDYVGSIDGVTFDGGSTQGQGTTVTLGVTSYIPGFLEQLVGHMPGENFNIDVTFPESYHAENLAGKDAVFNITINYIENKKLPELTDEFVLENLNEASYNLSTVEDVRNFVIESLREPKIDAYVTEYLNENCTFKTAPGSLITYMQDMMIDYYAYYADNYGMDIDTFLQQYEQVDSVEALKEKYMDATMEDVNAALLLQAIAEDQGIVVTQDEIGMYFEEINGSPDYSMYEEEYGLPYLMQAVLLEKVHDLLIDNVVIEGE
ncbi:MAG: trigger factor [Firmicutes bacterium]|nr:trigger factor [Bacillota bacterium]